MNIKKCIAMADELRPNTIPDETKAGYLYKLEAEIAEMMGEEVPENTWPEDREMLMPAPHDDIYHLYLCAMIDSANQETNLYANDMQMANAAIKDAKAWWRRRNDPKSRANWRTML